MVEDRVEQFVHAPIKPNELTPRPEREPVQVDSDARCLSDQDLLLFKPSGRRLMSAWALDQGQMARRFRDAPSCQ